MQRQDGVSGRIRRNFGKIEKTVEIPSLIDMQKMSYERLLQKNVPPEEREDAGLQGAFKSVFPINDFAGTSSLEFVKYSFEDLKYDEEDCLNKGMTYEAPIKLTVRLAVFDTDVTNGTKSIRDIKEQEIYFGTLPMMTDRGTFIINGTERVVVSQLHRSPGVFFDHDKGKTHSSGKLLYSARIIPLRGSWLDFEFDPKDFLYVRIDRRRKFPVTILLKALGYSTKEILRHFYKTETIGIKKNKCWRKANIENLYQKKISKNIVDPKSKKVLAEKGDKYTKRLHKTLKSAEIDKIPIGLEDVDGRVVADDVIDPKTGEILAEVNQVLTREMLKTFQEKGIEEIDCLVLDAHGISTTIRDTMLMDKIDTSDEGVWISTGRCVLAVLPPRKSLLIFSTIFFLI